jgi:hypothetical protein
MAKLHFDLREEQIGYYKIRAGLFVKCALEIKTDLDLVYGENALPYRTIARWASMFKKDRTPPISATS